MKTSSTHSWITISLPLVLSIWILCIHETTADVWPNQPLPPVPDMAHIRVNDGIVQRTVLPPPTYNQMEDDQNSAIAIEATEDDILGQHQHYEERPPTSLLAESGRVKRKLQGGTWVNGVVPYEFSTTQSHSASHKAQIRQAMQMWEAATCVTFIENPSAPMRLYITNDPHACSSYVGYQADQVSTGRQVVKLNERLCFTSVGVVAHELGHVLGLIHEHSRTDRDDHIDIHLENVADRSVHNFLPFYESRIPLGVKYDLQSVMHYGPTSFRKTSFGAQKTITAKNPRKNALMGQRVALSFYDIMAVNLQYCSGSCPQICQNDGYPMYKSGQCKCVCPEGLGGSRCDQVVTDTGCGGVINLAANGVRSITSPGYPGTVTRRGKCVWLVNAPRGYLVEVMFESMDIKSRQSTSCSHNVEIRDNVLGQRGSIYCGDGAIGPFDTRVDHMNHQMMIILDTSDISTGLGSGFSAKVQAYTDGCLSKPCMNGGLCISTGSTGFSCECEVGYTGARCEKSDTAAARCDFSQSLCMFTNDKLEEIDMQRMISSNKYHESVTTPRSTDAFFIGAPVEYSNGHGDEARLLSPVFSTTNIRTRCVNFSYKFAGSGSYQHAVLTVSKKTLSTGFTEQLFTRRGPLDSDWIAEQVEVRGTADYQILFSVKASNTHEWNSLIALDNIAIEPHACHNSPCDRKCLSIEATCVQPVVGKAYCQCPAGKSGARCDEYDTDGFVCEFESEDLCGWTNNHGHVDQYDWKRVQRQADAASQTGPKTGAGGGGHYLLADSSTIRTSSNKALLVSPRLGHAGYVCVEFSYHMFGGSIGSLALKVQNSNNVIRAAPKIKLLGQHSSTMYDWRVDTAEVRSFRDTKLVFEAISGAKHQSDIAIDKIKVTQGRCALPQSVTASGRVALQADPIRYNGRETVRGPASLVATSPPPTTVSSEVIRRELGGSDIFAACNFDSGICRESFVALTNTHQHKWLEGTGGTVSSGTGPAAAHTGDKYLYIEGSDQGPQEKTVFTTHKIFNSAPKLCVTFYYSMYGTGIGSLAVSIKPEIGTEAEVWRLQGNQGQGWREAVLEIPMGVSGFYQVIFTNTRGGEFSNARVHESDTALDSISIRRGACPTGAMTQYTSSSSSISSNTAGSSTGVVGNTIGLRSLMASLLGSGSNNNIDISCDFESNDCSPKIMQSRSDSFDWRIFQGGTPTFGTGPDRAYEGVKYIYVESSYKMAGANAILETEIIPANAGAVCVKFAYHMKGSRDLMGTFRVTQKSLGAGADHVLLNQNKELSTDWQLVQRELPSSLNQYKITFEVVLLSNVSTRHFTDVGLDNISIKSGGCS